MPKRSLQYLGDDALAILQEASKPLNIQQAPMVPASAPGLLPEGAVGPSTILPQVAPPTPGAPVAAPPVVRPPDGLSGYIVGGGGLAPGQSATRQAPSIIAHTEEPFRSQGYLIDLDRGVILPPAGRGHVGERPTPIEGWSPQIRNYFITKSGYALTQAQMDEAGPQAPTPLTGKDAAVAMEQQGLSDAQKAAKAFIEEELPQFIGQSGQMSAMPAVTEEAMGRAGGLRKQAGGYDEEAKAQLQEVKKSIGQLGLDIESTRKIGGMSPDQYLKYSGSENPYDWNSGRSRRLMDAESQAFRDQLAASESQARMSADAFGQGATLRNSPFVARSQAEAGQQLAALRAKRMADFYDKEVGYNIDERDKGFNRSIQTASAQQGLAGVQGNMMNGMLGAAQNLRGQAITEEQQGANIAGINYQRKLDDFNRRVALAAQKLGISQGEAERLIQMGGNLYSREDIQDQRNIAREDAIAASKAADARAGMDGLFRLGGAAIGGILASPAGPAGIVGGATVGSQVAGAIGDFITGGQKSSQQQSTGTVYNGNMGPPMYSAPNVSNAYPSGKVVGPTGKVSMGPEPAPPVVRRPMLTPAAPPVFGPVDTRRKQTGRSMSR